MQVKREAGMTLIVKTVTRLTLGFILLYGVYITLNGHIAPGGGFAGGVIIALSFVHIMLAFGKETALKRLHATMLRMCVAGGALLFLWVFAVTMAGGCVPFNLICNNAIGCALFNEELIIPLAEMVTVGAGIFAIFVALVLMSKGDKDSE